MTTTRLLALDFDGVVCDSLEECLVTTYCAYDTWRGAAPAGACPEIPEAFRQYFTRARHFVRPAGEYWILADAYAHGAPTLDAEGFARRAASAAEQMAAFERTFFAVRRGLMARDLARWIRLHRIYLEFARDWPRVKAQWPVYLVTTKDRESVGQLMRAFGIDITEARWWTREHGTSKAEAVRTIARAQGMAPAEVLCVDDNTQHLDEVAATGAATAWAAWGFLREAPATMRHRRLPTLGDVLCSMAAA